VRRTASLISALVLSLSAVQWCCAGDVDIKYALANLGANRWQYTYDVTNNALILKVEEFTIWFDLGRFDNLAVTTSNPPSGTWSELVAQPSPVLGDDGFYDALSLTGGIDVGQAVQGFSVAFDWLGSGTPGPQAFEILNPATYQPIFTGMTSPEPATLLPLLPPVMATLLRRRRR
jgi:hypothetical protein